MKQLKYAIQKCHSWKRFKYSQSGIHYFRFACIRYLELLK